MTTTTYYDLNIVEGTDIVNPLTVDNPNYEKIDVAMHNNAVAGVTLATEIANATVHAITRENSDCAVIRFIATSRWKAGDTATVDGVPVTVLLPNGETLPDGAYVINANVLCILTGTNLTVYIGSKTAGNANEITFNDTTVAAELVKLDEEAVRLDEKALKLDGEVARLDGEIDNVTSNLGTINLFDTDNMTSPVAYSNRVVVQSGGYIVKNGICYINCRCKVNTSLSGDSSWTILSGLPKPKINCAPLCVSADDESALWKISSASVIDNSLAICTISSLSTSNYVSIVGIYKVADI